MNRQLPKYHPVFFLAALLTMAFLFACSSASNEPDPSFGDQETDGDVMPDGDDDLELDGDEDSEPESDIDAEAEGEDPYNGDWIETTITEEPFSVSFSWDDGQLTALATEAASALYIYDRRDDRRINLSAAPLEKTVSDGKTILKYGIGEDRTATIEVGRSRYGAARIHFQVENKDDAEQLCADFRVAADEGFYGLMERVVPGTQGNSWDPGMTEGLNLRGMDIPLSVSPTLSIYSPFYVSSAGYGVYIESDWPGVYRFAVDRDASPVPTTVSMEYEGPSLTMHIIPGPLPLEATERYAQITGPAFMPPKWTFGPWRWRDDHYDIDTFYDGTPYDGPYNSMVVEDILMMEALGIPCSLYWVDRPWATGGFGYDDFQWDEHRLPQPVEMIQWLAEKNIKFMLWVAPWAVGEMSAEAEEKGYAVENALPSSPANGKLLDLTNPEAVAWWQDAMKPRILEGVVGMKLDRGEEKVPDGIFFTGTYDDGTSYLEGHNAYPRWYAKAVHDAYVRADVEEFVAMPRSGWVGSQKYAIFWGGDTKGSSYGLRSAIIAAQRSAVMNFPIWGSDTCGYGSVAPREVCARWLAFSAFTPLMEVGPTGNYALWSMAPDETGGHVGWDGYSYEPIYDAELLAIWHFYANLHNDLVDYTYEQAELAHEKGTPIVRPMILSYPAEAAYVDTFDQYLYGPDILVAPIWQENLTERQVLIPPDGVWIDAWTGEVAQPGSPAVVQTPTHKIPIFVRQGAGIDLGDLSVRWEQAQLSVSQEPNLAELVQNMQ